MLVPNDTIIMAVVSVIGGFLIGLACLKMVNIMREHYSKEYEEEI